MRIAVATADDSDLFAKQSKTGSIAAGIFWMFVTGLCFLGVTVVVRYVGTDVPAPQAAFIRYVFGTLLLLPAFVQLGRGELIVRDRSVMLLRGVLHGLAVILWFYAMARIPISQVTALGYLTPVLVTVAAALFLGEVLHARRLLAVVAGFIGVLIIVRPGFEEISAGQWAQLGTTPLFAASMLLTKRLTRQNDAIVIVAGLSLICTLTLLPLAMLQWVTPSMEDLVLLCVTAVLATLGHYTMTLAIGFAPLSTLQPISFLQLIWATIAGYLLFSEAVDIYVVLGGSIIVASASYIAHRESRLQRGAG